MCGTSSRPTPDDPRSAALHPDIVSLRAVIHSSGPVRARWILLGVAVPAVLGAAWIGDYIIAAAAALGATGAWHMDTGPSDARPMSALWASVIGIAYAATVAVHAGAVIVGLWSRDIL